MIEEPPMASFATQCLVLSPSVGHWSLLCFPHDYCN